MCKQPLEMKLKCEIRRLESGHWIFMRRKSFERNCLEAGPLVCDGRQQFEINTEVWNMKSEICLVFLPGQKATLEKQRSAKWEALKSNGHKLWLQVFAGIKTWKWSVITSVQVWLQVFVGIKTMEMKRDHKCSSTSVRWHKDFENEVWSQVFKCDHKRSVA